MKFPDVFFSVMAGLSCVATGAHAQTLDLLCFVQNAEIAVQLDLSDRSAAIEYSSGLSFELPISTLDERWIVAQEILLRDDGERLIIDIWVFERATGRMWSAVFDQEQCPEAGVCEPSDMEHRMFNDTGICSRPM